MDPYSHSHRRGRQDPQNPDTVGSPAKFAEGALPQITFSHMSADSQHPMGETATHQGHPSLSARVYDPQWDDPAYHPPHIGRSAAFLTRQSEYQQHTYEGLFNPSGLTVGIGASNSLALSSSTQGYADRLFPGEQPQSDDGLSVITCTSDAKSDHLSDRAYNIENERSLADERKRQSNVKASRRFRLRQKDKLREIPDLKRTIEEQSTMIESQSQRIKQLERYIESWNLSVPKQELSRDFDSGHHDDTTQY
ncbi:hypothetical protein L486_04513 [Kwoniella mangroviensis CBS 10435]|uniref:BZIP domain-containing protein n=2 Tax=Kwoniella mangrovensis TaxID=463800 RepID=A0A1B9ISK6_9TREE|nr:hypothetical protein L486_04513 [Kwoniella mangroviensis CBS 10435]